MPFTNESGHMTTGARWLVYGTLAAGTGAITAGALHYHDAVSNPQYPSAEATYNNGEPAITEAPTPDQTIDAAGVEPEATVSPTPSEETTTDAPQDTEAESGNSSNTSKIPAVKKLGKATCNYWGISNHQPIEWVSLDDSSQPFVRIDSRNGKHCSDDKHGIAVHTKANSGSGTVHLDGTNDPRVYKGKVLDGSLVAVTGIECGTDKNPLTTTARDGEKMPSAAWLTIQVGDATGKIPISDTGYTDAGSLRNQGGLYQHGTMGQFGTYDGC